MKTDIDAFISSLPSAIGEDEYMRYIFRTQICEAMTRWGFDQRFLREFADFNHAKQQKVFRQVCELMTGKGAIVALVGIRGVGKTTIAAQFALGKAWSNYREAQRTDGPKARCIVGVSYRKAAKLIARYKALYADFGTIETDMLLASVEFYCKQMEFAIIDELHECEDRKVKDEVLSDIVDRRYAALRDTILISNQTVDEFKKTTPDSVLSRLNEHGCIIPCNWGSFR